MHLHLGVIGASHVPPTQSRGVERAGSTRGIARVSRELFRCAWCCAPAALLTPSRLHDAVNGQNESPRPQGQIRYHSEEQSGASANDAPDDGEHEERSRDGRPGGQQEAGREQRQRTRHAEQRRSRELMFTTQDQNRVEERDDQEQGRQGMTITLRQFERQTMRRDAKPEDRTGLDKKQAGEQPGCRVDLRKIEGVIDDGRPGPLDSDRR